MNGEMRISPGCDGSADLTIVADRASCAVALEARQPVDRDRDRGTPDTSRCRPSHTTGHTGPYHGGSAG
jgi:hypothetical protein